MLFSLEVSSKLGGTHLDQLPLRSLVHQGLVVSWAQVNPSALATQTCPWKQGRPPPKGNHARSTPRLRRGSGGKGRGRGGGQVRPSAGASQLSVPPARCPQHSRPGVPGRTGRCVHGRLLWKVDPGGRPGSCEDAQTPKLGSRLTWTPIQPPLHQVILGALEVRTLAPALRSRPVCRDNSGFLTPRAAASVWWVPWPPSQHKTSGGVDQHEPAWRWAEGAIRAGGPGSEGWTPSDTSADCGAPACVHGARGPRTPQPVIQLLRTTLSSRLESRLDHR